MIRDTVNLEKGRERGDCVNELLTKVMALPQDKKFVVEIEESRDKLPANLLARIKIPVRKLAKFHDLTYEQMNDIIHDRLYPKRDKTVGGITYQVFVPSNQLLPSEAREIEVALYQLAADIGCPLPWPGDESR
jgi:hypothetical protein